jgi:hypothetical protein
MKPKKKRTGIQQELNNKERMDVRVGAEKQKKDVVTSKGH